MSIAFHSVTPILRIFDIAKAEEFYRDFLGFSTDWDHRFGDDFPLYRQISRGGLVFHLSEHHGDGSPGVHVRINTSGIAQFHAELESKNYRYMKPGLDKASPDRLEMTVIDPFGNKLTFVEEQNKKNEQG
ncbi:hypothetical protein PV08_10326 [Exophiala spinifera]|uniref:Bleomycin resistance protein n=1 Tax=Exophiala spinifera TaxID=91928 RepID=A0A0D1ZDJ3_9EURO|nr:uncharacterized protein PV08_10326 [Exophiala spinifera]KIW11027.1 hypothetical protein PV08_10326 [Exophiala spinifera]